MSEASTSDVDSILKLAGHDVRVRLDGEGEPLFLLSGLRQPLEAWDPIVASLGERRVVRCDIPGTGASATPPLPLSMASLAAIAAAVLDAVSVDTADVVGFSLGGAIAQQLAHSFPGRVRRLVLVATSCGVGSVTGRWRWRDARGALGVAALGADVQALTSQSFALATWSSVPFLGSLRQPTLVVCGRDDAVSPPSNSKVLASRIPGARLVTLDADHGVLSPGPATALARAVEDFLGRRNDELDGEVVGGSLDPLALLTSHT